MSYAQQLCDDYNRRLGRSDCEWMVDNSGKLFLGQKRAWTEAYTRQLDAQAERDRQQFKHRMKYPIHREAAE